jgi:hypothetical protein
LSLELYRVTIKGDPIPSSEIEEIQRLDIQSFENKIFNLAPSFSLYIPDLIKDNLL